MTKRAFDLFFSTLALLVFAPLLLCVSAMSFFVLGSPIFFTQRRIGKDNREFVIYKFRSMSLDVELSEDERLGFWGKFLRSSSIDELPELLNILKGEMSFVGPRPLLPEYLPFYSNEEAQRHTVTPGLTGLAQIRGRNTISWKAKFDHDLEYVATQSFWGDVKIILETFICVFKRSGINSHSGLTMERLDNPFYIVGGGGHGKSVLASTQAMGHEVRGILDDAYNKEEEIFVLDIPLCDRMNEETKGRGVLAIGNASVRRELSSKLKLDWQTVIHPSAEVHRSAKIGKGTVILSNVHIGPDVVIGKHTIINTKADIEHDCIIGDFCHIAPGTTVCGGVKIGDEVFIGAGTSIIPMMEIEDKVSVGAGSTVVANLDSGKLYVGTPARELVMRDTIKNAGADAEKVEVKDIQISMAGPVIDQDDIDGVVAVLKSGHLSLGPKIVEFEESFKKYTGNTHAIACSSGTAALHMILLGMGIGKGDEVIVPSFTFVSSVSTILHVGATPVYVDIDPETYCLDPQDVDAKITENTKAIMGVDIFGHPADWPMLTKIAKDHGIYTIDDSCEALGAEIDNKRIGAYADASTFAFYPNKQITTGEGGLIVTSNDFLAEKFRMLRNHGRASMGGWLKHDFLGYNFRMDEMSASLGVTQMKKVDKILAGREAIANKYNEQFAGQDDIRTQIIKENVKMSWFVYVVTLTDGMDRDHIISKLHATNIPARAYFEPIHSQPFMDSVDHIIPNLPVTDNIAKRTIALPFHAKMTDVEIEYVATTLRKIVTDYKKEMGFGTFTEVSA